MKLTEEQIEMASKLTSLQRKMIINVVSGMTHREAYLRAGGTAKGESSIDTSAAKIMSNSKVKAFYNSVMNTVAEGAIFKFDDAVKICHDIATNDLEQSNYRVGAIKQVADMLGWNAPKKTEISGSEDKPLNVKTEVTAPEIASALNGLMDKL